MEEMKVKREHFDDDFKLMKTSGGGFGEPALMSPP